MRTVLAVIGGFVILLAVIGMLNIGNFVMMYSPDKISCVKGVKE
jgi:hypothetical protein